MTCKDIKCCFSVASFWISPAQNKKRRKFHFHKLRLSKRKLCDSLFFASMFKHIFHSTSLLLLPFRIIHANPKDYIGCGPFTTTDKSKTHVLICKIIVLIAHNSCYFHVLFESALPGCVVLPDTYVWNKLLIIFMIRIWLCKSRFKWYPAHLEYVWLSIPSWCDHLLLQLVRTMVQHRTKLNIMNSIATPQSDCIHRVRTLVSGRNQNRKPQAPGPLSRSPQTVGHLPKKTGTDVGRTWSFLHRAMGRSRYQDHRRQNKSKQLHKTIHLKPNSKATTKGSGWGNEAREYKTQFSQCEHAWEASEHALGRPYPHLV